jgi:hypothetical protein
MAPTNPVWSTQPLEAYPSSTSVVAGEPIHFHVSVLTASSSPISLEIYASSQLDFGVDQPFARRADSIYIEDYRSRISVKPGHMPAHTASIPAAHFATPANASTGGCGWPVASTWNVPTGQRSSVYMARFMYQGSVTYALFVVRPQEPGSRSKILCQLSVNTYQAYNPWGGSCYYGQPISDQDVAEVALDRPCQLWDYIIYDQPIVSWLERNYDIELCTNTDLHNSAMLLAPYQLFVSTGHDEYWSTTMRDRVESFAHAGGNVMFLSGNTCHRRVELAGNIMRKKGDFHDPENGPRWSAGTTCVNWSAGRWSKFLPPVGFVVRRPWHWVFAGTDLVEGALLGQAEGIIGYETDAAAVTDENDYPLAQGENGTPFELAVLATADLTRPPQVWADLPGCATMGIAWRGDGMVMTAGTTAWGQGLKVDSGNVHIVTRNLVDRLRERVTPSGGILYAVNSAGDLLFYRDRTRDGTGDLHSPSVIGPGGWNGFKHLFSGGDGILNAITHEGNLLFYRDHTRDGTGEVHPPSVIGPGGWSQFKSVFSGGEGILYAITHGGKLLFYRDHTRDGTGEVQPPSVIGPSGWNQFKSVFSGGEGILYAITHDGNLLFYRDHPRDGTGEVHSPSVIGCGGWNELKSVFADGSGAIYAITFDGRMVFYRDWERDGTGDVGRGQTIGRWGWEELLYVFSGD